MPGFSDASSLAGHRPIAEAVRQPSAIVQGHYAVTLLSTPDALAGVVDAAAVRLPFQNPAWIDALMATVGKARNAWTLTVVVRETASGQLAVALPLALWREHHCVVASFPNFGVTDYGGPVLGPAAPQTRTEANAMWRAIRQGLHGVDLIRFENMPAKIMDRANMLAEIDASLPSPHHAHSVRVDQTVEEFLRSRGKKFRKEVERCFRLLNAHGPVVFARAESAADIAAAYAELERQQADRRKTAGAGYILDAPEFSDFYRQVIADGTSSGTAHLFTLTAGGETVATLFGLTEGDTFMLLRIANGGERWRTLSPGRLIVVEAMHYFVTRGVRTFDMGIGDYAFKRGFGADPQPLANLVSARTWRAFAPVAMYRIKAATRRNAKAQAMLRYLRDRISQRRV